MPALRWFYFGLICDQGPLVPTPQSFNSGLSPSACSRGVSRPFRIFQRFISGNAVGRPASGPVAACRDFTSHFFCQVPVIYFALSLHPMELGSVSSGRVRPCSTQGLPAWRRYFLSPYSNGLLGEIILVYGLQVGMVVHACRVPAHPVLVYETVA